MSLSIFKRIKNRPGFTLMEVVVVLLIFTLSSIIIAEIFVNVQRAQQRTRDLQSSYTDARYLLEVIAREIRAGSIDYSSVEYASGIPVPTDELHLITSQNDTLVFRKSNVGECAEIACVTIDRNGAGENPITTPKLQVDRLQFYITPTTNPFPDSVTTTTEDIQPQVTVVLKSTSTNTKVTERTSTYLQTTVTSRAYLR